MHKIAANGRSNINLSGRWVTTAGSNDYYDQGYRDGYLGVAAKPPADPPSQPGMLLSWKPSELYMKGYKKGRQVAQHDEIGDPFAPNSYQRPASLP